MSILLCATGCFAQKVTRISVKEYGTANLKTKSYVENPYLDKFTGKWFWENDTEKFTVEFEKKGMRMPGTDIHLTLEMLIGKYKYYKNGVKSEFNEHNLPFIGTANSEEEPVQFTFTRPKSTSIGRTEIEYIDRNTVRFRLRNDVSQQNKNWFPLPKDMILKRVVD